MRIMKRPKQMFFRDVKPNWNGLFAKLGGVVSKPTPNGIASSILGAFQDLFKLKPVTLEEEVFLLIQRSLIRAVAATVQLATEIQVESLRLRRADIATYLDAELDRATVSTESD